MFQLAKGFSLTGEQFHSYAARESANHPSKLSHVQMGRISHLYGKDDRMLVKTSRYCA